MLKLIPVVLIIFVSCLLSVAATSPDNDKCFHEIQVWGTRLNGQIYRDYRIVAGKERPGENESQEIYKGKNDGNRFYFKTKRVRSIDNTIHVWTGRGEWFGFAFNCNNSMTEKKITKNSRHGDMLVHVKVRCQPCDSY